MRTEGRAFRGTTSFRRLRIAPAHLRPDDHRGPALTGSPAPFYSAVFRVSSAALRATFGRCCCGGSQPAATPSLPAHPRLLFPAFVHSVVGGIIAGPTRACQTSQGSPQRSRQLLCGLCVPPTGTALARSASASVPRTLTCTCSALQVRCRWVPGSAVMGSSRLSLHQALSASRSKMPGDPPGARLRLPPPVEDSGRSSRCEPLPGSVRHRGRPTLRPPHLRSGQVSPRAWIASGVPLPRPAALSTTIAVILESRLQPPSSRSVRMRGTKASPRRSRRTQRPGGSPRSVASGSRSLREAAPGAR